MQIPVRANLLAADFALVSNFMGRSVLLPGLDQKGAEPTMVGEKKDNNYAPEAYYMHNVVPTMYGYKSVSYDTLVAAAPAGVTFNRIIPVRDANEARGYLGITTDGRTFIFSTITSIWTDVTPAGQLASSNVTFAFVRGVTYVCYSSFNIYVVHVATSALAVAALTGITNSAIIGICGSNNYLLLHDGTTVYWSSAVSATDFVPSLITGAGSDIPAAVGGTIVLLSPVSTGYAVYTTTNIIAVQYTGNTRYPWIFKEASNGAGIAKVTDVVQKGEDGCNYAWTASGLLKVTLAGCAPFLPEVTDFLAGRIFEDYSTTDKKLHSQNLTSPMNVQVSFSSSRYVVISYGLSTLTHALIYDIALKRMGKLRIEHVGCFEFSVQGTGISQTYLNAKGLTYTGVAGLSYTQVTKLQNVAAEPKHTLAFIQPNGAIKLAIFDYGRTDSDAVLICGKYQVTRTHTTTLQSVIAESIDPSNTNFNVYEITSPNGHTYDVPAQLTPLYANTDAVLQYGARKTGLNTSIMFVGSFHLVSLLLIFSKHGRR